MLPRDDSKAKRHQPLARVSSPPCPCFLSLVSCLGPAAQYSPPSCACHIEHIRMHRGVMDTGLLLLSTPPPSALAIPFLHGGSARCCCFCGPPWSASRLSDAQPYFLQPVVGFAKTRILERISSSRPGFSPFTISQLGRRGQSLVIRVHTPPFHSFAVSRLPPLTPASHW